MMFPGARSCLNPFPVLRSLDSAQPLSSYHIDALASRLSPDTTDICRDNSTTLWFGKKPKLLFLKVWGCDAYVKRLQPDKLEPKPKKCVFIGYPKETVGYTFYHRSEGKIFVAKSGSFLEKEVLSKEVSGRKVELHEVIVPVMPTPTIEEANDNDHENSDQVTTKPRRSTRACSAPEWYGNPILEVMLLDMANLRTMKKL